MNMSDKIELTKEQVELLDNMCFGAHEVKLGSMLHNMNTKIGDSVQDMTGHEVEIAKGENITAKDQRYERTHL